MSKQSHQSEVDRRQSQNGKWESGTKEGFGINGSGAGGSGKKMSKEEKDAQEAKFSLDQNDST
jgi:hypothetical protein